jgi:hypothetical protein
MYVFNVSVKSGPLLLYLCLSHLTIFHKISYLAVENSFMMLLSLGFFLL